MEDDRDEKNEFEEVYDDESREDLVDNDQISPEEEAFMSGYDDIREKKKIIYEGDEAYERAFEETNHKRKKKK
jgi:hypothetical protein